MHRFLSGLALASLGLLVTGCDLGKGDDTQPQISKTPLAALPDWATPLQNKVLGAPGTGNCLGAFDVVTARHNGPGGGVEVEGWAWLQSAKRPPSQILFLDKSNKVVGAAETVHDRPDVQKAYPEITTPRVGWHGEIAVSTGSVSAVALLPDNSTCLIGAKDLMPS